MNPYMLSRKVEALATDKLSYWTVLFDDSHHDLPPSRYNYA